MLQQLNQYLFQFRVLTLPSFGTIKLEAQPARLDVVEHLIYAPALQPHFTNHDDVSDHQVEYFSAALQKEEADVEGFFISAGEALLRRAEKEGTFHWTGIGTFEYSNNKLYFNPEQATALAPVQAKRVMRENVQHSVLVGDQVVMSDPNAEVLEERRQRDYWVIAAWIIAVLAVLFIAYFIFQQQGSPQASGLQMEVQPAQPQPTWQ